jgi:diguanylate cyclase (GGDEF)-like protein
MFTNGMFFLVATSFVSLLGVVQRNRIAFSEFRSQQALFEATDQLEQLAARDPLTGLFNRRSLAEKLDEALQLNRRYQAPFTVALFDLDHFKKVNDVLGHAVGDLLLQRIGNVVNEHRRHTDIAFRIGGDEFLILYQSSNAAQSTLPAHRLHNAIQELAQSGPWATTGFGVSMGLLELGWVEGKCEQTADVIAEVDALLYEAKRQGRGQVIAKDRNSNGTSVIVSSPSAVVNGRLGAKPF